MSQYARKCGPHKAFCRPPNGLSSPASNANLHWTSRRSRAQRSSHGHRQSVNSCPYCEGLHGQLARMAGVDDPDQLMAATSIAECTKVIDDPAIVYARTFAEQDGRGEVEEQAFHKLAEDTHVGFARSVRALCWFLLWGSIGGNTLNGFFARLAGHRRFIRLFELLFTATTDCCFWSLQA